MRRVFLRALLALALPAALSAGAAPEHVMDDETLLADAREDVLVVTVRKVDDAASTNGKPPHAELSVDEVLRGKPAPAPMADSVWRPIPHDVDYGGADAEARIAEWNKQPLKGPKAGAKMIVKGEWSGGAPPVFEVSPRCRYDFDEKRKAWALEVIHRPPPATEETDSSPEPEPPEPSAAPSPSPSAGAASPASPSPSGKPAR